MTHHPEQPQESRPFLKWNGGKQRLLARLLPLIPGGSRLIEPFVGAGSVSLATNFEQYILSDANADLSAVWAALKDRPTEFVERASELFVEANRSNEAYLRIRAEFNAEVDVFERAIRLVYLNRFGYNGLFRVNKRGGFNVPYGKPPRVPNFPREHMKAAAVKLERAVVLSGDFVQAMELAGEGDVVYCDPPYSASREGKSFTAYTARGFTQDDHRTLVEAGLAAARRGAYVLISNHDTAETRDLYRGWEVTSLSVRRSVSAKSDARRTASELLAALAPAAA